MCTCEQPQGYYVTGKMDLDKDSTSFLPLRIFFTIVQSIFSEISYPTFKYEGMFVLISYVSIISSSPFLFLNIFRCYARF